MDVIRRNTDYALRAMVNLAREPGCAPVSVRQVAKEEDIPYQLACKLMQRLHRAGLVESAMGPVGGFRLNSPPSKISVLDVIGAIQGPVRMNRCVLAGRTCPRKRRCRATKKFALLQKRMERFLSDLTLQQLV